MTADYAALKWTRDTVTAISYVAQNAIQVYSLVAPPEAQTPFIVIWPSPGRGETLSALDARAAIYDLTISVAAVTDGATPEAADAIASQIAAGIDGRTGSIGSMTINAIIAGSYAEEALLAGTTRRTQVVTDVRVIVRPTG